MTLVVWDNLAVLHRAEPRAAGAGLAVAPHDGGGRAPLRSRGRHPSLGCRGVGNASPFATRPVPMGRRRHGPRFFRQHCLGDALPPLDGPSGAAGRAARRRRGSPPKACGRFRWGGGDRGGSPSPGPSGSASTAPSGDASSTSTRSWWRRGRGGGRSRPRRSPAAPRAAAHHRVLVLLVERGGRLVQEDPARPVQQQPREGQALLLAERQHAVPALLLVQPLGAARPGRSAPAPPSTPRRRNRFGRGRVGQGVAQRAERQVGALRQEHRASRGRARGCGRRPRARRRRGRGTGWTCRCRSRPGSAPARRGGSPRRPGAPAACRPGWRRRRPAGTRASSPSRGRSPSSMSSAHRRSGAAGGVQAVLQLDHALHMASVQSASFG